MQVLKLCPKIPVGKSKYGCRCLQRNPKILLGKGKYKFGYFKLKWKNKPKCNTHISKKTHLNGLDTLKWRPSPKHNMHMQSHFEITQP